MRCLGCGIEEGTSPFQRGFCPGCESQLKYKGMEYSTGWECPRCHQIHSPYVMRCDCPASYTVTISSDTKPKFIEELM